MARETVRIEGLADIQRRLTAFPAEMSKNGGPVRTGLRKAGNVIKKQAQANIAAFVRAPNDSSWPEISTGLMEKSVKVVRAKAPRKYRGESVFVLIPKRARYPITRRTPSGINVALVATFHEYGLSYTAKSGPMKGHTVKLKATRWMGRAYAAKKDEAVRVMVSETEKAISKIERKLSLI